MTRPDACEQVGRLTYWLADPDAAEHYGDAERLARAAAVLADLRASMGLQPVGGQP